jgi:hypothetical protein
VGTSKERELKERMASCSLLSFRYKFDCLSPQIPTCRIFTSHFHEGWLVYEDLLLLQCTLSHIHSYNPTFLKSSTRHFYQLQHEKFQHLKVRSSEMDLAKIR